LSCGRWILCAGISSPTVLGLSLPNAARGDSRDAFDAAFGAGAGDAWLRVVDHGSRAWSAIRPRLVEVPDAGRGDLWRLLRSSDARRAVAPRRTLRQVGEDAGVRDPRMWSVLDEYARGAGAVPDRAPAVLTTRIYIEQTFGAWRIVGGLSELATAMYERCLKRGVSFRFDAEVSGVASGVVSLADGERLAADVIVAAVDAHVLAGLTGRKATTGTAVGAGYSPSILSVKIDSSEACELPYETVIFGEGGEGVQGARGASRLCGCRWRLSGRVSGSCTRMCGGGGTRRALGSAWPGGWGCELTRCRCGRCSRRRTGSGLPGRRGDR
jgi:phytoene dehydrogenase-like protein